MRLFSSTPSLPLSTPNASLQRDGGKKLDRAARLIQEAETRYLQAITPEIDKKVERKVGDALSKVIPSKSYRSDRVRSNLIVPDHDHALDPLREVLSEMPYNFRNSSKA